MVPIIFMAVVYCKISRALIQQEKYMNRVFSYEMRRRAPASFISLYPEIYPKLTNCLSSVLCYAIGNVPYHCG